MIDVLPADWSYMADQIAEMRKALDKMAASLAGIAADVHDMKRAESMTSHRPSRREPSDVTLLTDAEVEELRALAGQKDIVAYSAARVESDSSAAGMYAELERFGFIVTSGEGFVVIVLSAARWAVEKHPPPTSERESERERQWRHDRKMTWIAAIAGLVGAIIGGLLSRI